jgi:hypothetical protein
MPLSPLEEFVRDYAETAGGAWDEVEKGVYDLLLPENGRDVEPLDMPEQRVVRVAFDPEAIPEHPGSQLASFGTPLVDRMLAGARERGSFGQFYFLGLNLAPHGLPSRARRGLVLGEGVDLRVERMRVLHFPLAFFGFQATFVSDQKEQEALTVGVDLHSQRQIRHRDKLLDPARLSEQPALPFAEAPHAGLAAAYPPACEEVLRTLATLAHARDRELRERLDRQVARMHRYYDDLRQELEAPVRGRDSDEAKARRAVRLEAVGREERLRIAELRQKNSLRVELRLLSVLEIYQPKLLMHCQLTAPKRVAASVDIVWDPLLDNLEAIPCPCCRRPTFHLDLERGGKVVCEGCGVGRGGV